MDKLDPVERTADEVIEAYRANRLRLWLVNFTDHADDFGDWAGTVRVSAERYLRGWAPDREALVARLRQRAGAGMAVGVAAAAEELLPLAQDGFVNDLAAKKVPHKVADRARRVFLPKPPLQQWKM